MLQIREASRDGTPVIIMPDLDGYLSPGDGVLDLGANCGEYAERYAKIVGETGCVMAVEPDPEMVSKARARCERFKHVSVMSCAVDALPGRRTLYLDTDRKRNSLWFPNVLEDAKTSITVDASTLDCLAGLVPNLKGIKIDTQGAEGNILLGAAETLKRTDLTWYVEIWPDGLRHAGSSVEDVVRQFEAAGWVPVGATWQQIRDGGKGQSGHSAMDVLIRHKDAA